MKLEPGTQGEDQLVLRKPPGSVSKLRKTCLGGDDRGLGEWGQWQMRLIMIIYLPNPKHNTGLF